MVQAPFVSDSIVINAAPSVIFDVLANPRRHFEIDGSGTLRGSTVGPERLSEGAEFGMKMRMAVPYTVTNTVVSFQTDREIAWRHFAGHLWRYQLEPLDGGRTRVTESWDTRPMKPVGQLFVSATGFPRRTRRGITATLERLKRVTEDTPSS